jgi:hypothetical protein
LFSVEEEEEEEEEEVEDNPPPRRRWDGDGGIAGVGGAVGVPCFPVPFTVSSSK